MQFPEACEQYILDLRPRSAEGTMRGREHLNRLLIARFGDCDLGAISSADLRKFISQTSADRKWSSASLSQYTICLKVMFKWFVTEGYIEQSPSATLKRPKFTPDHYPVMTAEEISKFLATPIRKYPYQRDIRAARDKCMFYIGAYAGLRLAEVLHLSLDDVDLKANRMFVQGKRSKNVWQMIPEVLADQLFEYLKVRMLPRWRSDSKALFYGLYPHKANTILPTQAMKRHLATCGLPSKYSFHSLRHTYATTLMRSGVDMRRIQELLRHENLATTLSIYMHPDEQDLRDAVARLAY